MKVSAFVLAVVAQVASAHYFFDTNIINGNSQPSFKHVQTFTCATKYNPIKFSSNPAADIRDGSFADGVDRSHVNPPEHHVSCVQIQVVNGGNGSPGPLVKFPGAYSATDAYAKFSIYGGDKTFPFPRPAVWNGVGGSTAPPTARPTTPTPPSNPPSIPPPSPPRAVLLYTASVVTPVSLVPSAAPPEPVASATSRTHSVGRSAPSRGVH
ncbi:fungal cellulose binding domain-containing protein [Verticillium alfalfae VaMs.102]|uniref:lytic cellulose monooxygenase (C4-dehydrogenating) n=1 Tax=Verticillium alfalfae (strain VaMs.102 / ATCC MYA-4576 / FGSC 10136) TaxID=526221 RepID=C9SWF8_VERA1|nr:fungal cellulose binding domain-containing protein [Verticillium alfalfae VaMs.102]EEY23123.1 fungal cellulose binding domain-containing protein [Verticillium alfalfae VaMs.102]